LIPCCGKYEEYRNISGIIDWIRRVTGREKKTRALILGLKVIGRSNKLLEGVSTPNQQSRRSTLHLVLKVL
jgi:hypothetical protein